jgi:hypothetical protein
MSFRFNTNKNFENATFGKSDAKKSVSEVNPTQDYNNSRVARCFKISEILNLLI